MAFLPARPDDYGRRRPPKPEVVELLDRRSLHRQDVQNSKRSASWHGWTSRSAALEFGICELLRWSICQIVIYVSQYDVDKHGLCD